MFFAHIFDTEVVNNQCEKKGASVVGPKRWSTRNGVIAIFGEVCGELIIGNPASLFQPGHALADFHVNPAIGGGEGLDIVLGDDLGRDFGEM